MKTLAFLLGLALLTSTSNALFAKGKATILALEDNPSIGLKPSQFHEFNSSDDFDSKAIRPQWETTNNDKNSMSLTERPGYLRLKTANSNSTSCQLFQSIFGVVNGEVAVLIAIDELSEGTTAGISLQSNNYSSIGIQNSEGKIKIINVNNEGEIQFGPTVESKFVILKTTISNNKIKYEYSLDLNEFKEIGDSEELSSTDKTNKLGLFCFNPSGRTGSIDIDWFYSKLTTEL